MWIEPIVDRIQADVDIMRLDPTNENTKGAFNYTDLNRIETNCEYIMNLLNNSGFADSFIKLNIKKDWNVKDIPTITELNRIRNNIIKLINGMNLGKEYEEIEFSNTLNYIKANILEKNLELVKNAIEHYDKQIYNCGAFFCGLDGLPFYAKPIKFIPVVAFIGEIICGEGADL